MTIIILNRLMEHLVKIKSRLFTESESMVKEKVNAIKNVLTEVQNAANNETKSSAGDKHETGRAMAQLETEKLSSQLAEALKLEQVLHQINPKEIHKTIRLGSLVVTNNGNFYITISLGKLNLDAQIYYAISAVSPIAKQLIGLSINDSFSFNGRTYSIDSVT